MDTGDVDVTVTTTLTNHAEPAGVGQDRQAAKTVRIFFRVQV